MAVEVFIHKMSEHMETARIIRWLVEEGERVEKFQVLMEVETDKAVADLESPASGVMKNIRAGAVDGAEVLVGETLAFIAEPDEEVTVLPPLGEQVFRQEAQPAIVSISPVDSETQGAVKSSAIRATPVARRVAKDLGVDINLIKGSGPGGRIREQDVRSFAQNAVCTPSQQPSQDDGELQKLTTYQSLTGQRMLESVQTAPQFALDISADMTNVLWLRQAMMDRIVADTGARLSITMILVKIVAEVLKLVPQANASFENGHIKLYNNINIGVAIGSEAGLIVPVIKDAGLKSLTDIASKIIGFQNKAEEMRFKPEDLTNGTFTITNLGMFGIDRFNAIINPPQSAILAVGRIIKTPTALEDDSVVVKPMGNFTLTIDHRCLDGIHGAKFLRELKSRLEEPYFVL